MAGLTAPANPAVTHLQIDRITALHPHPECTPHLGMPPGHVRAGEGTQQGYALAGEPGEPGSIGRSGPPC